MRCDVSWQIIDEMCNKVGGADWDLLERSLKILSWGEEDGPPVRPVDIPLSPPFPTVIPSLRLSPCRSLFPPLPASLPPPPLQAPTLNPEPQTLNPETQTLNPEINKLQEGCTDDQEWWKAITRTHTADAVESKVTELDPSFDPASLGCVRVPLLGFRV